MAEATDKLASIRDRLESLASDLRLLKGGEDDLHDFIEAAEDYVDDAVSEIRRALQFAGVRLAA